MFENPTLLGMPKSVFPSEIEQEVTTIDQTIAHIKELNDKISNIALYDIKYPNESVAKLQDDVLHAFIRLHEIRRKKISVGDWVRVFVADATPFYGKVKQIEGNYVALCGVFNHTDNKRNAYELDNVLPVPYHMSLSLEKINKGVI